MKKMKRAPTVITPAYLGVVVMPNGEVICLGRTVGWVRELLPYLYVPQTESRGEFCGTRRSQ